jgi:uncharacterized membrane protein
VSTYDWLLFLHMTGAFLLVGGGVVAAALNIASLRRDRPSEILVLFGLIRIAVAAIIVGSVLALVFGLWLVNEAPFAYSYSDGWVIAAIVLLIAGNAIGGYAGSRDARTAKYAEELAAAGDTPSKELQARVRNPITLAGNYVSGLLLVALVAIMIWKPGA